MTELEWRRLRNLTARQIINELFRDGFELYNQRGACQRYLHPDGRRVTVTVHHGSDTAERSEGGMLCSLGMGLTLYTVVSQVEAIVRRTRDFIRNPMA